MKGVLKYLILIFVGAVLLNVAAAWRADIDVISEPSGCADTACLQSCVSPFYADLCNSIQNATAKEQSLKKGSKRTENNHRKIKAADHAGVAARHTVRERLSADFSLSVRQHRAFVCFHTILI